VRARRTAFQAWSFSTKTRRLEPHLACTVALHAPRTGIVDSHALMLARLREIEDHGGAPARRRPVESLSIAESVAARLEA
jgi:L-2-hydroxyglutarate oxidase LhgO